MNEMLERQHKKASFKTHQQPGLVAQLLDPITCEAKGSQCVQGQPGLLNRKDLSQKTYKKRVISKRNVDCNVKIEVL